LDYDGTLAPFRVERERAFPYPGVRDLLEALIQKGRSRVVIVSGRWTRDLLPLLGLKGHPEIWGSHGWERLMPDGTCRIGEMDETALKGLAEADQWIEEKGWKDRAEQKPGCLALHWRGRETDEIRRMREEALQKWSLLAGETGLQIAEFEEGIELRVPGRNKGTVVQEILSEAGEESAAAYLGDDLTDEDAFRALKGRGLGVLVRPELRATAADLWIKPPEELLEFLSGWLNA
jgi:trehalose-phosphatase